MIVVFLSIFVFCYSLLQKDDCVPMFADVTPFLVRDNKIQDGGKHNWMEG